MKTNWTKIATIVLSICLTLLFLHPVLLAQETESETATPESGNIIVKAVQFCSDIQDRTPVNPDSVFTSETEKVYCLVELDCKLDEASIQHLWYHNETLMNTVDLKVAKSPNWRTWSYKSMFPGAVGKWEVVVKITDGEILKLGRFEVK